MWCSTRTTAGPPRRPLISAASSSISAADSPAAGSSSSSRSRRLARDAQLLQPRHGPLAQRGLVAVGARQRQQPGGEPGPRVPVGADHHVLQHAQAGEQPEPLQGAGDAEPGQPVRPVPAERPAAPAHLARARADEPAHDVEQGRLARPVRPDHARDPARRRRQRHLLQRDQPAEADGHLA
jgi:hypothetical protein